MCSHTIKTSASAGAMAAVGNKHCIVDFPLHSKGPRCIGDKQAPRAFNTYQTTHMFTAPPKIVGLVLSGPRDPSPVAFTQRPRQQKEKWFDCKNPPVDSPGATDEIDVAVESSCSSGNGATKLAI